MLLISLLCEEWKIIFAIDIPFVSDTSVYIDALSIDANHSFKQQIASDILPPPKELGTSC